VAKVFPGLGKEFMPPLDEGSYLFMPTTMPHASIGETMDVLQIQDAAIGRIPEVESVVGKLGRAETPLDPAPISMIETVINYRPEFITNKAGDRVTFQFDEEADAFARDATGDLIPDDDETLGLDLGRLEAVKAGRAERAAAYFRLNAARWDEIRKYYVDETEIERAMMALLPAENIGELLDIGTGTGRMLEVYGAAATRAVGIDTSRDMLAIARANLDRAGLRNCQVRLGDMYQLPAPNESFDTVTVHQVLHYADAPGEVIAEAARVLRPGGRLMIVDFAPHREERLRTEHEHRRLGFSDKELANWLNRANLVPGTATHLRGAPLTVCVWPARRPANDPNPATPGRRHG